MGRGGAQRCSAALAGGLPEPPSPGGGGEEWRETLKEDGRGASDVQTAASLCSHYRKVYVILIVTFYSSYSAMSFCCGLYIYYTVGAAKLHAALCTE